MNEKKKTARCHFERHGAASSPLQMQRQGRRRFLKKISAILPLSLSTPLAQKSRMTHTHTYTTIPCNSHASMPCTWTGYGEPLPRLPINTGERTKPKGRGDDFFEKERNEPGGKILEKEREAETKGKKQKQEGPESFEKGKGENRKQGGGVCLRVEELGQNRRKKEEKGERRVKEQDRRGRRRATVAPPPAPLPFLPATTDRTAAEPPSQQLPPGFPATVRSPSRCHCHQQIKKKEQNTGDGKNR